LPVIVKDFLSFEVRHLDTGLIRRLSQIFAKSHEHFCNFRSHDTQEEKNSRYLTTQHDLLEVSLTGSTWKDKSGETQKELKNKDGRSPSNI
jgi:hypothetical protein